VVTGGALRIEVDRELCCGSGNCVRSAPGLFDQDDTDGLVVLRRRDAPPEEAAGLHRAVTLCPAGAIRAHP
jgi:ferredoxin